MTLPICLSKGPRQLLHGDITTITTTQLAISQPWYNNITHNLDGYFADHVVSNTTQYYNNATRIQLYCIQYTYYYHNSVPRVHYTWTYYYYNVAYKYIKLYYMSYVGGQYIIIWANLNYKLLWRLRAPQIFRCNNDRQPRMYLYYLLTIPI